MNKKKTLFLISFSLVTILLINCWIEVLITSILATKRHYVGLLFFVPLIYCYFKKFAVAVIGLGIYLLLATFNLLAFTPKISTSWITIGTGFQTPLIQPLALGLLLLYLIMNRHTLYEIELDYKESKASRAKRTAINEPKKN
jgi:hypothetical protein